jgi:hypothetical protein
MTIESELKKLTEAVTGLTQVLASAAISTPNLAAPDTPGAVKTTKAGAAGGPGTATSGPAETTVDTLALEPFPGEELYAEAANSSADEIRARLTPLIQSHGQQVFEGALSVMGFTMLSELTPDRYPQFLARVAQSIGQGV